MYLEFDWYFLLPVFLVVLYGCTMYHDAEVRGLPSWKFRAGQVSILLAMGIVTVIWLAVGFSLLVFYILLYLIQASATCIRKTGRMKFWFFLNLNFVNMMAFHMTFISLTALIRNTAMYMLMGDAVWRTASVSFVLTVCIIEQLILLYMPHIPSLLTAEAESDEAVEFMAFLSFCTGYLLLDSLLCMAELAPTYPALFLIGSSAVLTFFLLRFLMRIHAILREEYLRKENDTLSARLESAQKSTGTLRRLADRDVLTDTFSRRYIMDCIDERIKNGQQFSLVFLDLDGLKLLNDKEGHDAGDRYLIKFSREMEGRIETGDLFARVGGDEFIVLMPNTGEESADRRMDAIREGLETGKWERHMRFSYGISTYMPGSQKDADALLKEADEAMYRDKIRRR